MEKKAFFITDEEYRSYPGLRICIEAKRVCYKNNIPFESPINWPCDNHQSNFETVVYCRGFNEEFECPDEFF